VGAISGFVLDQSGAWVLNAKVTILDESTGDSHSAASDSQGHYTITVLRPAAYSHERLHSGLVEDHAQAARQLWNSFSKEDAKC
jgi:hypothetical protein